MRSTYRVTYRSRGGRVKTEDLQADSLFDSAASVCQSHHLDSSDIVTNVVKDSQEARTGRKGSPNDR